MTLSRRAAAEGIGTAFLLAAIVGSGIMAERLSGGNVAVALLANTLATAAALVALILTLGPVSGAHFNPWVTLLARVRGRLGTTDSTLYVVSQLLGAFSGVAIAHVMFGEPLLAPSHHARSGVSQAIAEGVATFGLLVVVGLSGKSTREAAIAVGAYIAAAYWFTSSTSFANLAVTLARSATDTFAGIRAADVPGFLAGQLVGTVTAIVTVRWLSAETRS